VTNTSRLKKDYWTRSDVPSILTLYDMAMKRTRRLRGQAWREDLIQDAMVKLIEYLQQDKQDIKPVTYLLNTIDYLTLDALSVRRKGSVARVHSKLVPMDAFEDPDVLFGEQSELEHELIEQQERTTKQSLQVQLVQRLEGTGGEVIRMLLSGLTGRQIAEQFKVTPQAVSHIRKKAERELREAYHALSA